MRRIVSFILHLYPRTWQARYATELETLIEDSGASWSQIPNLLLEALKMQINVGSWRPFAALGIIGLLVALAVSFRMPDHYTSNATLVLQQPSGGDPEALRNEAMRLTHNVLSRTSLANLMQEPALDLYKADRERIPLEDIIEAMKKDDINVQLTTEPDGRMVAHLSYRGVDAWHARATVQHLLTRLMDENQQYQRIVATTLQEGGIDQATARRAALGTILEVLDPPNLPTKSSSPNRWMIGAVGMAIGLLAALGILGILRHPLPVLVAGVVMFIGGVVAVTIDELPIPCTSAAVLLMDSGETRQHVLDTRKELLSNLRPSVPGPLSTDIRLEPDSWPNSLTIAVHDTNRFRAQRTAQTVISGIIDAHRARRKTINPPFASTLAGPWIEVLDPPSLPVTTFYRTIDVLTVGGLALAIVSGIILSVRRRSAARAVPNPA